MTAQQTDAELNAQDDSEQAPPVRLDEEDIRLLTGFTDVFSAFVLGGLFLFISALASLAGAFLGGLLVAVAAWFLTPYFVVKRRFAACAILLALAFGIGITAALVPAVKWFAPIPAAAGLWFYWRQYKVPISAALTIVFATLVPVVLFFNPDGPFDAFARNLQLNTLLLLIGFVLFAAGLYWDVSDRERLTRRSDVAFWLHLVAGPLMVHGTFSLLGVSSAFGLGVGSIAPAQEGAMVWPVFLLVAIFALVSIIVDRRPLLIASFSYLVFAIGVLAYRQFAGREAESVQQFPAVLMTATMITGTLIVVLAGTWSHIRRFLLSLLPVPFAARLAPIEEWTIPADDNAGLPVDEKEPLRLMHGLNDYMAAVGMGSLFVGSIAAGFVMASKLIAPDGNWMLDDPASVQASFSGLRPWLIILIPMVVVGLLASLFVRYRRMALTGVAASFQFWLLTLFAVALFTFQFNLPGMVEAQNMGREPEFQSLALVVGCIAAAGANFAFWRFNRVPVAFALGFAMLFPLMFPDVLQNPDTFGGSGFDVTFQTRPLFFGLIAFAVAMLWDRRDLHRKTQRADNGFWMHLLAAIFFIPAAYSLIGEASDLAMIKLVFFAVLIAVALLIDRRAMLLVALPTLVESIATSNDDALGLTGAVVLFAALTLLNLQWDKVRDRLIPQRSAVTA